MNYRFSAETNAFYPWALIGEYKQENAWPENGVDVDESVFAEYSGIPPEGEMRGSTVDGMPAWIDIPPPTHDELVASAEAEKQNHIDQANAYMNSKQWPGKAAMKRLSSDDYAKYNLWLDYLDALDAVDTTSAPDIAWPTPPASPAS